MSYLKAISAVIALGSFGVRKALDQKRSKGTLQAAKNLRKQGVPLEIALSILCHRERNNHAYKLQT